MAKSDLAKLNKFVVEKTAKTIAKESWNHGVKPLVGGAATCGTGCAVTTLATHAAACGSCTTVAAGHAGAGLGSLALTVAAAHPVVLAGVAVVGVISLIGYIASES